MIKNDTLRREEQEFKISNIKEYSLLLEELGVLKDAVSRLSKLNLDKNKILSSCYYNYNKRIKYLEGNIKI